MKERTPPESATERDERLRLALEKIKKLRAELKNAQLMKEAAERKNG